MTQTILTVLGLLLASTTALLLLWIWILLFYFIGKVVFFKLQAIGRKLEEKWDIPRY